jgi:hypothetical protein
MNVLMSCHRRSLSLQFRRILTPRFVGKRDAPPAARKGEMELENLLIEVFLCAIVPALRLREAILATRLLRLRV